MPFRKKKKGKSSEISVKFDNLEEMSEFFQVFLHFGWWTWLKLGDRLKTLATKMTLFFAELGLPPSSRLKPAENGSRFGQV